MLDVTGSNNMETGMTTGLCVIRHTIESLISPRHCSFDVGTVVLIASVPGHLLPFTFWRDCRPGNLYLGGNAFCSVVTFDESGCSVWYRFQLLDICCNVWTQCCCGILEDWFDMGCVALDSTS